jgi:hypothetical protein
MAAPMPGGGADTQQEYLARALSALIALRRFDSPIHQARAVHNATLALRLWLAALGDSLRHRSHDASFETRHELRVNWIDFCPQQRLSTTGNQAGWMRQPRRRSVA